MTESVAPATVTGMQQDISPVNAQSDARFADRSVVTGVRIDTLGWRVSFGDDFVH